MTVKFRLIFTSMGLATLASTVLADPSPTPTPFSQEFLNAKWVSIGDTAPLYPVQESTLGGQKIDPVYKVAPALDGEETNIWAQIVPPPDPSPTPSGGLFADYQNIPPEVTKLNPPVFNLPILSDFTNTYYAGAVHAIFGPAFSITPLKSEYSGAHFSSIFALNLSDSSGQVDVVGAEHVGVRRFVDEGDVIMDSSHATINLTDPQNSTIDWKFRTWFIDFFSCDINEAFFSYELDESNRDSRSLTGTNTNVFFVKFLVGATSLRYYDIAHLSSSFLQSAGAQGQTILQERLKGDTSYAFSTQFFRWIWGSYMNIGTLRGTTARLDLTKDAGNPSGASNASADRRRSINHWIGLSSSAPSSTVLSQSQTSAAMSLAEQTGIFNPIQIAGSMRSLESHGIHVLGDGKAIVNESGYSTDVLHVRDLVHLNHFSTLPNAVKPGELIFLTGGPSPAPVVTNPGLRISLKGADGNLHWYPVFFDNSQASDILKNRVFRANGESAGYEENDNSLAWTALLSAVKTTSNSLPPAFHMRAELFGTSVQIFVDSSDSTIVVTMMDQSPGKELTFLDSASAQGGPDENQVQVIPFSLSRIEERRNSAGIPNTGRTGEQAQRMLLFTARDGNGKELGSLEVRQ